MVDKLTKRKLKNFFVYDLWKVVVFSAILCVVFVLIFNFVSKKPSDGQDFKIMLDDDVVMGKGTIDEYIEQLFTSKPTEGGFSYEMLKGETMYIRGTEENPEEYLLGGVYCDLNYDDVCFLGKKLYLAYLKMPGGAVDINEYIKDAKAYLFENEFCDANGVFNESKVFEYFDRTRKGDSRFRTKGQKEKGRLDELERLKGIYFMATSLEACFVEHPYLLDEQREGTNGIGQKVMGSYALKLSELDGGELGDISRVFSITPTDEEDETSSTEIYLAIGNNKEANGDLYYEMLAVLYKTIQNYSTYLS